MAKTQKFTKEQIEKAQACKTAEELMALAEAEGIALTKEEAEAYLSETVDYELGEVALKSAAGGDKGCYAVDCPAKRLP